MNDIRPGSRRTRANKTIPLMPLVSTVAWPAGLMIAGLVGLMLLTAGVGWVMDSPDGVRQMLISAALTAAISAGLLLIGRKRDRSSLGRREAILIVIVSWSLICLVGGLPFLIGADFTVADAIFEATSGFTASGATILPEIRERLNPALHFWRLLAHWLGGMGVVVLFIAVFPALGVGGKHLYRSEVPGPRSAGLSPRIRQTALSLWRIYLIFTATLTGLLILVGLPVFESVLHAFSVMATGGFSPLNGSAGGFESELGMSAGRAAIAQWIIIVFMVLGSLNYALYNKALRRGPRVFLKHTETRVYLALLAFAGLAVGLALLPQKLAAMNSLLPAVHDAFRESFFHLVSIASTTGFATVDYNHWPTFAKILLLGFYFTGGCAGSTTGGLKVIRWVIMFKAGVAELRRSYRPHLISPVRVDKQVITQPQLLEVAAVITMFFVTAGVSAALVALFELMVGDPIDGTTAVMASLACVGNVGPGLGMVGPVDNYGFLSGASKLVLSACMLLGRLEFLTVLAILTPGFWRR